VPDDVHWHSEGTMQKTRLNIYLNEQQKEKLEKIRAKTGAPMSELVRRAIDLYLKKES
jgi:hypothetical protein